MSESVIRGLRLKGVNTRIVGQKNSTLWELDVEGGPKVTTFLAGLGNKAQALTGQFVDMVVEVSQNGDFTNYKLQKIQASGNGASTDVLNAAANAAEAAAGKNELTFEQFSQAERDRQEAQKAKETSIHRQCAAKVAGALVAADNDVASFWPNVLDLVKFFETGQTPFSEQKSTNTANLSTVTSHSAEQQADFGGGGADDDIPF